MGCKKVITFTGMKFDGMDRDKAIKDCLDAWKQVLPLAEKKGITLVLEHLNSRDGTQPMKGHPGYFGDDVEFCVDLVKQIGSPELQAALRHLPRADHERRRDPPHPHRTRTTSATTTPRAIRAAANWTRSRRSTIPPIMQAIIETGYDDYVAQEFIPTWSDPVLALRHACMVCDV